MDITSKTLDLKRDRTRIHHKNGDTQQVYVEDAQDWFDKGWVDTTAKFEVEMIVSDGPEIEPAKETTEIPTDDASDLSDYLNETYGLTTNFRMGLKKLKKILKGKQDDNG